MDYKQLFYLISDIGCLLLKHGAEIYRVEESVIRMTKTYGFDDVEVFAIPSFLTLTVMINNEPWTITRRSRVNRINLDSVYELNNLVRNICNNTPTVNEIEQEIKRINNIPLKMNLVFLGYGLTAGFFSIFFGGGLAECLVGLIVGFVVYFVIWLMEILEVNNIVSTLISSIALSTMTISASHLHIINNLQATTIGCLMVLVPGVAITNSLRDIIGGEYISGLARMLEALLIATSIALGVGCMLVILGG